MPTWAARHDLTRRLVNRLHLAGLAIIATLHSSAATAQSTPELRLKPHDARLTHEFTTVTSVRELADGRVLVSDEKENQIILADFSTQRTSTVGRKGNGPGEYRQVGRLWPLGGDSTLMADPFARRWLVFNGARVVSTRSPNLGRVEGGQLLGVDRDGRATYAIHSFNKAGKLTGLRDSMYVVRMKPGGSTDTIARVPSEYAEVDRTKPAATLSLGSPRTTPRVYKATLFPWHQVITFADGFTAVARSFPYRVDWCAPSSRCTSSAPIAEQPVRVNEAEKQAFIRHKIRTANWRADLKTSEVNGWPEVFPPFTPKVSLIDDSPLHAMPDGRLLVERLPSASWGGVRYDVFDRRGARVAHVVLADNQQIVGFGRQSVYVVVTDDDNLQYLQRHPWP